MPIYNYKCKDCSTLFEKTISLKDYSRDMVVRCVKCRSSKTKRIIEKAPTINFKGRGFYINDSKHKI